MQKVPFPGKDLTMEIHRYELRVNHLFSLLLSAKKLTLRNLLVGQPYVAAVEPGFCSCTIDGFYSNIPRLDWPKTTVVLAIRFFLERRYKYKHILD